MGEPGNKGNRRKRQTFKPLPWYEDPVVLERMTKVERSMRQGWSAQQVASALNAEAKQTGGLTVSTRTVQEDFRHIREVYSARLRDELVAGQEEYVAEIEHVAMRAWEDHDRTNVNNPSRQAALANVIKAKELVGKVKGYVATGNTLNLNIGKGGEVEPVVYGRPIDELVADGTITREEGRIALKVLAASASEAPRVIDITPAPAPAPRRLTAPKAPERAKPTKPPANGKNGHTNGRVLDDFQE